MAVSASIYNAIGQGVTPLQDPQNALLKALRMQGAQEEMQAQRMTRARTEEDYRRGVERSNRLQQLLSGEYADDEARAGALVKGGFIDEGQKLLKGRADLRKIGADTDKTLTETDAARYKQHLDLLGAVQDPESFKQWVQLGMSSGAIKEGGNILLQAASQVQTPQQFQQLQARVGMGLKDYLEKNAPKFSTVNAGNAQVTTGRGGLFGEVMPELGQTTAINQSPDNAASNARQAADAAAARALTLRGQNMVDARAREGSWSLNADGVLVNSRTGATKAATGPGGRPVGSPKLNELQGKATGFASRMKDAEKTLGELEDKVMPSQVAVAGYKSEFPNWLPGGQILGAGITAANRTLNPYVTEEAMKYQQAQENWVRANLRLESGAVIGAEEMQKEIQTYFPQPGDPKSLRDQKKAARAVAQRAVTAQAGPGQNMIEGIAGGQPSGGASGTWDNADPLGLRR